MKDEHLIIPSRRGFLFRAPLLTAGLVIAAPAIVNANTLMPLKGEIMDPYVLAFATEVPDLADQYSSKTVFMPSRLFAATPKRLFDRVILQSHDYLSTNTEYVVRRRSECSPNTKDEVRTFTPRYVEEWVLRKQDRYLLDQNTREAMNTMDARYENRGQPLPVEYV